MGGNINVRGANPSMPLKLDGTNKLAAAGRGAQKGMPDGQNPIAQSEIPSRPGKADNGEDDRAGAAAGGAGRRGRVCCLLERWESGGIEAFLYNVLTRIDLTQVQVDIAAASLGKSVFAEQFERLGIHFFELSGSQRNVAENHRRFRLLLQERQYDVLHLNAFQGLSLAYLRLARKAGVPVRIAHSHNTALRKSLARPLKLAAHTWAKRRYTRDATALWACSRDAAEFLFSAQSLKRDGFRFIPNGIDTARFRYDPAVRESVRTELGLNGTLVIGNIGRLCYQKNQAFLLEVLSEALKRNPDVCLLLVGEGEDRPLLLQKARHLGVSEKVLFYGLSPNVEQLLWAMDVFAFPSRFEGLGIAAIEAQAAGLPVLCSECVPSETNAAGLFRRLPLSAGAERWAKRLLEMPGRFPGGADAVRDAGFDIAGVARQIETYYLGRDGHG